eukprot:SM000042S15316  [mRNA]  locus=s42:200720:201181:- [translate_table: standard]
MSTGLREDAGQVARQARVEASQIDRAAGPDCLAEVSHKSLSNEVYWAPRVFTNGQDPLNAQHIKGRETQSNQDEQGQVQLKIPRSGRKDAYLEACLDGVKRVERRLHGDAGRRASDGPVCTAMRQRRSAGGDPGATSTERTPTRQQPSCEGSH